MRSFVACILFISLVTGCYPASEVRVSDSRPKIAIRNAPANAVLYVDGLALGFASRYSGVAGSNENKEARVLFVEPGRHRIEVKSNGEVLLSEDVFLGEGTLKTLKLNRK